MRTTEHRTKLLAYLRSHAGTISARELHKRHPHINLTTVYRNLDVFVTEGHIKKLHLHDNQEAVYEYQKHPHHHAICTNCNKVVHFSADAKKIEKLLKLKDFSINDVELVVRGTCLHQR